MKRRTGRKTATEFEADGEKMEPEYGYRVLLRHEESFGTLASAFCPDIFAAVKLLPTHGNRVCDMSESVRASATPSAVADPEL